METLDPAKVARVWQRVQGAQGSREEGLLELISGELTNGMIYGQLARQFQGKNMQRLRYLAEQTQDHGACLKGIYTLITGNRPLAQGMPGTKEKPETALRHCYGRAMRCLAAYEARAAEPEYGPVFARLAEREREHCRLLLELLGKLTEKRD